MVACWSWKAFPTEKEGLQQGGIWDPVLCPKARKLSKIIPLEVQSPLNNWPVLLKNVKITEDKDRGAIPD